MHLQLDVGKRDENEPVATILDFEAGKKISIDEIRELQPEEVICSITRKPCVLYTPHPCAENQINYSILSRCPLANSSTKNYVMKGDIELDYRTPTTFYVAEIKWQNH